MVIFVCQAILIACICVVAVPTAVYFSVFAFLVAKRRARLVVDTLPMEAKQHHG